MAKIWVKGYTKPDGTKVKGHYRSAEKTSARGSSLAKAASKTRVRKEAWSLIENREELELGLSKLIGS